VTGPAGQGRRAGDARGVASEGSVTVIDLAPGAAPVPRGKSSWARTPALGAVANGRWLVAASTGSDMLSIMDTRSDEVVETVTARQTPATCSARSGRAGV